MHHACARQERSCLPEEPQSGMDRGVNPSDRQASNSRAAASNTAGSRTAPAATPESSAAIPAGKKHRAKPTRQKNRSPIAIGFATEPHSRKEDKRQAMPSSAA